MKKNIFPNHNDRYRSTQLLARLMFLITGNTKWTFSTIKVCPKSALESLGVQRRHSIRPPTPHDIMLGLSCVSPICECFPFKSHIWVNKGVRWLHSIMLSKRGLQHLVTKKGIAIDLYTNSNCHWWFGCTQINSNLRFNWFLHHIRMESPFLFYP